MLALVFVYILAAMELSYACFIIVDLFLSGFNWWDAFWAVFFLCVAAGLIRRLEWARRISVGVLWMSVVMAIVGVINPFTAGEMMESGTEINTTMLFVKIFGVVTVALLFLHFFGRAKPFFKN